MSPKNDRVLARLGARLLSEEEQMQVVGGIRYEALRFLIPKAAHGRRLRTANPL